MKREGHRHLRRLDRVWVREPIFFVTTCTARRAKVLASAEAHAVLREVWLEASARAGWQVGRYVVMPDHVHFFGAPRADAKPLSAFVAKWKEWTAKHLHRRHGVPVPLWQEEFFDHILRSEESYGEKWEYVRQNPVRAGLVRSVEEWPYQGEIAELRSGDVERL